MSIIRKILLIFSLCIVLTVAALLVLFFVLTDPERLKSQIVEQIDIKTDRQVEIKGAIHWAFAQQLGVSFDEVTLKQPLTFDKNSTLKSPQVDVFIAWRPLFSRQIQVERVVLHQFVLSVSDTRVGGNLQIDLPTQHLIADHLTIDRGNIHATGQAVGDNMFANPILHGQLKLAQVGLSAPLSGTLRNIVINFTASPKQKQEISGDITAGLLQMGHLNATHLQAKFLINTDKMQWTNIRAVLAGGVARGQLMVMDWRNSPHYQIDATLSHVELSSLLESGILNGPADASLHLTATGMAQAALLASLNGSVQIIAVNGALSLPLVAAATVTHFFRLTASGTIQNGIFNNQNLLLKSPDLQATGAGAINLADKQVHYDLLVEVQNQNIGSLSIPLQITGTLSNPKVKVDMKKHELKIRLDRGLLKQLGI